MNKFTIEEIPEVGDETKPQMGELKTVKAKVSIRYEPNYIAKMRCPNCNKQNWDYLDGKENGKTLLHSCTSCEQDFYIAIPADFTPLK